MKVTVKLKALPNAKTKKMHKSKNEVAKQFTFYFDRIVTKEETFIEVIKEAQDVLKEKAFDNISCLWSDKYNEKWEIEVNNE